MKAFSWLLALLLLSTGTEAKQKHGHEQAHPTVPAPLPVTTPRLTVQIQPTSVTLEAGKQADLLVVAHNPGLTPVEAATLNVVMPKGVQAPWEPMVPQSGAGDLVWTIHLSADGVAPASFALVVELTYSAKGALPNTDLATANATVTAPPDLAASVKSSLAPNDGNLDQYNPLAMTVAFQNMDRRAARISGIKVLSPPYAVLAAAVPEIKIEPGGSASADVILNTADRVAPGVYTLVLDYQVQPLQQPTVVEHATVQGRVTIGVPGISDVMQLLGVSSFLLLPGALTVIAFFVALSAFTGSKELDWKSPRLLLCAVTLSICYAAGYPVVVSHFVLQEKPNYLHGYNVTDALVIWLGSCVVGAIAGVMAGWLSPLAVSLQKRCEPNEADEPVDILRKLACHRADFNLIRWKKRPAQGAALSPTAYLLLPFGKAPSGQRWIVRQGIATATADGAADKKAIRELLGTTPWTPATTKALHQRVKAAGDRIQIKWRDNFAPRPVCTDDYKLDDDDDDRRPVQTDRLFEF